MISAEKLEKQLAQSRYKTALQLLQASHKNPAVSSSSSSSSSGVPSTLTTLNSKSLLEDNLFVQLRGLFIYYSSHRNTVSRDNIIRILKSFGIVLRKLNLNDYFDINKDEFNFEEFYSGSVQVFDNIDKRTIEILDKNELYYVCKELNYMQRMDESEMIHVNDLKHLLAETNTRTNSKLSLNEFNKLVGEFPVNAQGFINLKVFNDKITAFR